MALQRRFLTRRFSGILARAVLIVSVIVSVVLPRIVLAADGPEDRFERVTVRRDGATKTLEGKVVVEAVDGGVLLERPDTALELLDPGVIVGREPLADGVALADGRDAAEIGRQILAELPAGFEVLSTKHYCICHDTSRSYAQWCGALFERLHDAFTNYWSRAGLPLEAADRPLVVVIFSSQERYRAHGKAALGEAVDRVAGYYDLMSNRVITYDLTGSDAVHGEGLRGDGVRGGAKLAALSSPAASGLVATLVHEATHQMAFNAGMHRRLAPVPLWVSEGVAIYFETPDLGSSQGWRAIGLVNEPRLAQWRNSFRAGDFARLVADDEAFRRADSGTDAYAAAWAMTSFLVQTRRGEFVNYLRILGEKEPLADDSAELRRNDFHSAFGEGPDEIEPAFLRFMARLRER